MKTKTATKTDLFVTLKEASKTAKRTTVQELELDERVDQYCQLAETLKTAKTEMKVLGSEITGNLEEKRVNTSIRALHNGLSLLISWTSRFQEIPVEAEGELRDIMGARYNSLIEPKNSIKVKDNVSNEQLSELLELVGKERFLDLFEVKQVLKPTEEFDERDFPPEIRDFVKRVIVIKANR